MQTGSGGKAPKISAIHNIAVYDAKSGRVVHMHRLVAFEGASNVDLDRAHKDALEHARRIGHDVADLKTLSAGAQVPVGMLRVDPQTKSLKSEPHPALKHKPSRK